MIDYQRKALLIKSGLTKKVKKLDKHLWLSSYSEGYDIFKRIDDEFIFCCDNACSLGDIDECRKINQATWKRDQRILKRIYDMLEFGVCNFLTLTFSDETLSKTSRETRRRYVVRYLKSVSDNYVANIDYGGENGREHYHALVNGRIQYGDWHKYGAIKGELIKNHTTDYKRVARYVSKLTNHAIKNTTKGNRVIYSR